MFNACRQPSSPHARRPVNGLAAVVTAKRLEQRWDVGQRLTQAAENAARQARNEAARAEGRPQELVYRKLYLPEQGMFADLPADLALGTKQLVSWLPEPRWFNDLAHRCVRCRAMVYAAAGGMMFASAADHGSQI